MNDQNGGVLHRGILIASCLFAAAALAGCASTKVINQQKLVTETEKLPYPTTIWVYDFSANPADIPVDSALTNAVAPATPPTDEEVTLSLELGSGITADLISQIQAMGMQSLRATTGIQPQVNDIVIRGYLVSIDKGSTVKRMTIGFGSGGSELTTLVEGYQMTAQGLRKLGSATLESGGSKGPGGAVGAVGWIATGNPIGLVVSGGLKVYGEASGSAKIEGRAKATAEEIAGHLKERFEQQGWIN